MQFFVAIVCKFSSNDVRVFMWRDRKKKQLAVTCGFIVTCAD